jgi:hypothetical protein
VSVNRLLVSLVLVGSALFFPVDQAAAIDLRIDYGNTSDTGDPGGSWNTLSDPALNATIVDLTDFITGTGSGVGLRVTEALRLPGSTGSNAWSGSPSFPSWIDPKATNDYMFVQTSSGTVSGQVTFDGLDANDRYRVEILGSRNLSWNDDLRGTYEVQSTPSDSGHSIDYNAESDGFINHEVMTWRSVQPDGSGQIVFDMTADDLSVAGYLSAMRISDDRSVLIDLGWSGRETTDSGWNNLSTSNASGGAGLVGQSIFGAVDSSGNPTSVVVNVLDDFGGHNSAGIPSTDAGFPSTAQSDSLYVDGFAATDVATMQIEGLTPGASYDVHMFGSRQPYDAVNDRAADYTVDHAGGSVTQTLINEGNSSEVASFHGVVADDKGWIQLEMREAFEFGYLGAIEVVGDFAPASEHLQPSVFFDFGSDRSDSGGFETPGNWNNITDHTTGEKIADAIDATGQLTGISLTIEDAFDGINDGGVVSNEGGFAMAAQRDTFHIGSNGASIRLSGLLPDGLYDLSLFGSRELDDDRRKIDFTIDGQTVTLDVSMNESRTADFFHVRADSLGDLLIDFNTTDGAQHGYLGAMRLTLAVPEPTSAALALAGCLALVLLGSRRRRV